MKDVLIFGEIGWDVTAEGFRNALNELQNEDVRIIVNTVGGSVFQGQSMFSAIQERVKNNSHKTELLVEGLAASMGSLIALAVPKENRTIAKTALFMIHNPSGGVWGDSDDMKKQAELLDKIKDTMVGVYTAESTLSESEIIEAMDAETWYTGIEAEEFGFFSEAVEEMKLAANFGERKEAKDYNFKNLPENIINKSKQDDMDAEKIKAELVALTAKVTALFKGDKPSASVEDLNAIRTEVEAFTAQLAEVETANADLTATVATLTSDKEALEAEKVTLTEANAEKDTNITKINEEIVALTAKVDGIEIVPPGTPPKAEPPVGSKEEPKLTENEEKWNKMADQFKNISRENINAG